LHIHKLELSRKSIVIALLDNCVAINNKQINKLEGSRHVVPGAKEILASQLTSLSATASLQLYT
jgi:hypothetical protein